ncbi:N-acetylmuramoyl-L-alanine amidase family protein [Deferrisoma camini]|uniref:N-acetylmuramoyl-L-alanine amidase family protein n=1 Tax=Deferrisoma camini TaxID=1035120 RepID=UPI00046CBB37|nr:N-acetylmuramoyl-L-alanine amidase [Deferrisoma camini]
MRVLIDPGHGGEDPGAVAAGVREADLALDVALRLAQELVDQRCVPILTRYTNVTTPLAARAEIERRVEPDLFVSVHCNAADNQAASGMEVWTSPGETPADRAATAILESLSAAFPDRRVRADWEDGDPDREARFYVLRKTRAPAVLVEMEFLTNPYGLEFLTRESNRSRMAEAIASGALQWLRQRGVA